MLLDVRVNEQFDRFKVEDPFLSDMANVPYVEFVEHEEESVAKVPAAEKVRIVCAKEGSARYVGEILVNHGFKDVRYLEGGIKTWGNMLAPKLVASDDSYKLFQFIRPGKASCSYGLISNAELEDDLVILPGHYMDWSEADPSQIFSDTLGNIKSKNSDIYSISTETEFIGFIKDNMRLQPKVYAEIRKVNAGLLEVDAEKQEIMDLGKNECAASAQNAP